jgi:hypothetical protein
VLWTAVAVVDCLFKRFHYQKVVDGNQLWFSYRSLPISSSASRSVVNMSIHLERMAMHSILYEVKSVTAHICLSDAFFKRRPPYIVVDVKHHLCH